VCSSGHHCSPRPTPRLPPLALPSPAWAAHYCSHSSASSRTLLSPDYTPYVDRDVGCALLCCPVYCWKALKSAFYEDSNHCHILPFESEAEVLAHWITHYTTKRWHAVFRLPPPARRCLSGPARLIFKKERRTLTPAPSSSSRLVLALSPPTPVALHHPILSVWVLSVPLLLGFLASRPCSGSVLDPYRYQGPSTAFGRDT